MFKSILAFAALAALATSGASAAVPKQSTLVLPAATFAKHGADDPAGDDRGRGGHGAGHAKRGADDKAGDDRGRGGHGAGHAKRGADDPAGDDRGRGGHGAGHA